MHRAGELRRDLAVLETPHETQPSPVGWPREKPELPKPTPSSVIFTASAKVFALTWRIAAVH